MPPSGTREALRVHNHIHYSGKYHHSCNCSSPQSKLEGPKLKLQRPEYRRYEVYGCCECVWAPWTLGTGSELRKSPQSPVANSRRALSDMRIAAAMSSGAMWKT